MSSVVLKKVDQVGDVVEVVDGGDSEFLGVGDCRAEQEATNSAETVDTELD
jgi:hypothetical protein